MDVGCPKFGMAASGWWDFPSWRSENMGHEVLSSYSSVNKWTKLLIHCIWHLSPCPVFNFLCFKSVRPCIAENSQVLTHEEQTQCLAELRANWETSWHRRDRDNHTAFKAYETIQLSRLKERLSPQARYGTVNPAPHSSLDFHNGHHAVSDKVLPCFSWDTGSTTSLTSITTALCGGPRWLMLAIVCAEKEKKGSRQVNCTEVKCTHLKIIRSLCVRKAG